MFGFDTVIGQQDITDRLRTEAAEGRLPHALLLSGPAGSGKMAIALALARYLSCENHNHAAEACGTCRPCLQWDKLMHPDVHFMFPIIQNKAQKKSSCDDYMPAWRDMLGANTYFTFADWLDAMGAETNGQAIIYTQESDAIMRKLSLKSVEGGYKTTIIWLPEKFQEACANKMLKLLEEPPQKTIFIMVSEEPGKILPTILSRAQQVCVPPIETEQIAQFLTKEMGIDPQESNLLAHMANGDFAKALQAVRPNENNQYNINQFIALMRLSYARKVREMKAWSEEMAALNRERQKDFLNYCQRMVRESFIYNFQQQELNYMNVEETRFVSRFAPFINERNIQRIEFELSEAQTHIEQNVNAKMVFFDFALQMIVLLKQ